MIHIDKCQVNHGLVAPWKQELSRKLQTWTLWSSQGLAEESLSWGWTAQSGQTPNAKRTPNLIKHILHQSTTFLLTVSMNILTFCHGVQFWPIFRRLSRKSNWPNVANVCPGNRIGQTSIIHSVWGDENYCTAIDVPTDPPRCSNSPPFTEKQCSL